MESIVVRTTRGKLCLISENRMHYLRLEQKGTSYWNCYILKCRANVKTIGGKIVYSDAHSCVEDPQKLEKLLMTSELYQDETPKSSLTVIDEERMRKLEMEVASDVTAHSDNSYLSVNDSCSELSGAKKKEVNNLKRFSDGVSSNSKMSLSNGDCLKCPMSIGERKHLMDLVEKYYETFTGPIKERSKLWVRITMDYNETEPVKKSLKQLRKYWVNLKLKLRKKICLGGLGMISKLPDYELRALGLMPKEEFGDLINFQDAIDAAKIKKVKGANKFNHDKSVCEIMMDDSNSNNEDSDLLDTEEENPLAVSTADNSSMDEQISFSKDPFSIPHVQDTSTFLPANYGLDMKTNNDSVYQEEHFYDLDEDPSLEDTPNVHVPDVHVTDAADFSVNPDSDIEVLPDSLVTNLVLSESSASVVDNINSVDCTTSEASDPSVDPLCIDPLYIDPVFEEKVTGINTSEVNRLFSVPEVLEKRRPQQIKISVPKSLSGSESSQTLKGRKPKKRKTEIAIARKPTMKNILIAPHFNIIPAKTFQSTKPNTKSDANYILEEKSKPKIKVRKFLFETKPKTHTEDLTNPFSPHVNLMNFEQTTISPIGSTATAPQSFSDTTNFKTPFMINSNLSQNYIFASDRNMAALAPAAPMLFNSYPISVANSIGAVPSKVGTVSSNNVTLSSNISTVSSVMGAIPSNVDSSSPNVRTVSSIFPAIPTPKATKPEEYLNFSRDYIHKRMKMEQTKFEYKMENLAKERQCIQERHGVEMKVLQLKLKYITAQYEDMLKRNRKQ